MQDLNGKVAWVTGAGTGIGRGGALKLAQAGVRVVLSGRRKEKLDEVAEEITKNKGEALVEPLDVTDTGALQQVVERIIKKYSRLDILVASAGMNITKRNWEDLLIEDWQQVIDVDLNGAFYSIKAVLPIMRKQKDGVIINICSWAGRFPDFGAGPSYNAAKYAMHGLTANLNMAECRNGIRACALCPGEVATPNLDKRPVPVSDEDKAQMLQMDDLGETILFVAKMPPHVCINEILITPSAKLKVF